MAEKTIVITRFDPDKDQAPRKQEYRVPCEPDWKVLDAVNFIKDELDGSVSHRWSCRMAVCGSCGMMVNGQPKLTCKTSINDYGDRIDIEPLANFPIVRDLVVELDGAADRTSIMMCLADELRIRCNAPVPGSPRTLRRRVRRHA